MLEAIRNAAKTWIAKVILVVITVPFALWGVESYIRQPGTEAIAKIGGEKITSQEFENAMRNQMDRFRQQFGQVDSSLVDNPEIRKGVLDQMIDMRLLDRTAVSSGLVVSDARLRDLILNDPNFQDGGKFSPALYERILKAQGLSAQGYEARLRQDLARQQFLEGIANTAFVSASSVQNYIQANEQAREVAVVFISPTEFLPKVNITPEQAKAYYDKNQAEFTIPEQIRAEYVELSIEALTPLISVTADEVKQYYETNRARYVTREERKASHILISVASDAKDADKKAAEEKAKQLFAQVKANPKQFPELAKKNSADPGSGANGGDLGFFGRGMMVPPFEKAVFEANKGDLVGPVLSDFGYHIILVTDVKPERGRSLADATPEIEAELKKQQASRKFAELAEKFSNAAFENSGSLKAAAEVAKLPIKQSQFFSKGQAFQPPFNNAKLSAAMFTDDVLKNKRNTEAVEIGANSLVVARVLETKPAVVRPLADVQVGLIQKLAREEAIKLAKADGEAKLKVLQEGKGGPAFPAMLAVSRANTGGLPPGVIDAAMRANPKTLPTYVSHSDPRGGFALIKVGKIIEASAADEAKLASTRSQLQQSIGQKELLSMVAQMRVAEGVTIKPGATDKPKADK
ncbi:MAG: SurA N-terminal domain-containing protein [Burkholderiales bacterium]|nr:SurA N-terminal domain-containing protein [Nitrosomonadaceae bacterium]